MSIVRFAPRASCGARLVWLRAWGFGEPRPVELVPSADGTVVVTSEQARFRVAVVPHTHWDREWHSAFETFRVRLVDIVDGVLDVLEQDPAFTCFLLDGHTALVDDYLEARPVTVEIEGAPDPTRAVAACRDELVRRGRWGRT